MQIFQAGGERERGTVYQIELTTRNGVDMLYHYYHMHRKGRVVVRNFAGKRRMRCTDPHIVECMSQGHGILQYFSKGVLGDTVIPTYDMRGCMIAQWDS